MELHCHRCGTNTHIVTPWAHNIHCWICGHTLRSAPENDGNATVQFLVKEYVADWLASAKETYDNAEEKVAVFLAKSYNTVEEFFSDDLIWWESEREFINNPLNAPPEARARFRDWT